MIHPAVYLNQAIFRIVIIRIRPIPRNISCGIVDVGRAELVVGSHR